MTSRLLVSKNYGSIVAPLCHKKEKNQIYLKVSFSRCREWGRGEFRVNVKNIIRQCGSLLRFHEMSICRESGSLWAIKMSFVHLMIIFIFQVIIPIVKNRINLFLIFLGNRNLIQRKMLILGLNYIY